MSRAIDLLRHESRARVFFAALTQSALGNGAAYVALLVIAYDRFESGWAIGLVLFADLVPSMLLSPVFGAAADRWSRRMCLVVSDVLRAGAFLGIALVDGFVPTVALAVVAGAGTGLYTPAALSALPGLVAKHRQAAATSLYGAIVDVGYSAGPGLAAALFLVAGAETILLANAATFAVSAIALSLLRFGEAPQVEPSEVRPGLFREAQEGMAAVWRMAGVRAVIAGSAALLLFAGLFNVAELPFVIGELDGGDAGFALLNGLHGVGFIGGSLAGAKGGDPAYLKRWWLIGLAVVSVGLLASGAAPSLVVAALAFSLAGLGNGLLLVYERLLIQELVPDRLMGRVFGVKDGLTAWTFAAAFLVAGGLVEAIGARAVMVAAGVGGLVVWVVARIALRGTWTPGSGGAGGEPLGDRPRPFRGRAAGEQGADAVGGGDERGALLDHSH